MDKANREMYNLIMSELNLTAGQSMLEAGFGSGRHIKRFFDLERNLDYTGIDLSATMVKYATWYNRNKPAADNTRLLKASIEKIPFNNCSFDRVVTANTIYFWNDPEAVSAEILRVLKPGGMLVLAANSATEMKKHHYRTSSFTLWEQPEIEQLLLNCGFILEKSYYKKLRIEDCILITAVKGQPQTH